MALLKKATVEQSAAKIAGFGTGGSGKSLTLTLIAIALSKTYHHGAPVALFDTEKASDWLLDIYAAEGVELLRVKSKSFLDMRTAHREAVDGGCCAFLADSYSHPWAELQSSLKSRLNVKKLEFHHMQELQELWQGWVDEFLNSPIHCLFAGRLAFEWENEVDVESGRMGFHKAGTKMRSEKDAGYEPHLLFEMEAHRVMEEIRETKPRSGRAKRTKVEKKAGGHFIHRMHVLKDRARVLNGRMFEFRDINDYKPGDWKHVFSALQPHFEKINISSGIHAPSDMHRSSAALFDQRGDSDYARRVKRVQIVIEEIEGSLTKMWPGQDAKSKQLKATAIETIFATRSWKAVESKSLEALEQGLHVLRLFEDQAIDGNSTALTDPAAASALLTMCKDQIASAQQAAEEAAVL